MTNFSFGRTDGRKERGSNNIPELSLESAGIIMCYRALMCDDASNPHFPIIL